MKTSIYVCYHNKCNMLEDDIFKYIYCGAAINGEENYIPGTLRDDTGDNISHKNRTLCELTAMYWAWKNDVDSDYIGFMHYRRHLNFSENQNFQEDKYGVIYREYIDDEYEKSFALNSGCINNLLKEYDMILPKPYDVSNLGVETNYDQYAKSQNHHIKDYIIACDFIRNKYPELEDSISDFNSSKMCYFTNIFIMRRDMFFKYAHFIFHIVFNLESLIDFTMYNPQEARSIAFMSERIFNIYVNYWFVSDKFKVIELQRTYINNTAIFNEVDFCDGIPIVFAFNNSYVKYAYQAIMSLVYSSNPFNKYCIYVLHTDISKDNISTLTKNITSDNFEIHFLDCKYFFNMCNFDIEQYHITKETYYRLLIPIIFNKFKNVIYLDADIIVKKDISELFFLDLGCNYVAGVHDYMMSGFVKNDVLSPPFFGCITAGAYLKKIGVDHLDYIQAGILIFNVKFIREKSMENKPFELINNKYWFNDQDIINIVYKDYKIFIDTRWNVAHGNGDTDTFFRRLPVGMVDDYFKSREDPYIIHFAGEKKPWIVPTISYANEFWDIARKSPYYEDILFHAMNNRIARLGNNNGIWDHNTIIDMLLPRGSYRRAICKIIRDKCMRIIKQYKC